MGCTQSRPSPNSPLDQRLEKLKMANGYVKGSFVEARRSTGHRTINLGKGTFLRNESRKVENEDKKLIAREVEKGGSRGSDGGWNFGRNQQKKKEERLESSSSKGNGIQRKAGDEDEVVDGWPKWLTDNIPSDALAGLTPRSAETYDKIDKVGQGTYSNVYKARDKYTGKIVALKKVRFDTSEPESVKFMAREIRILRRLDHPNVLKLEGLATSRMHYSIYLVFDCMQSDLASIITRPDERLTEPQVEQLHKIFKLCGTPTEDFWKRVKLPTTFRPPQTYKPRLKEAFRNFPASSFGLFNTLLALEPSKRGSAASALQDEFFYTSPLACDLSGLPVIKIQEEELTVTTERRRQRSSKMRHRSQSHKELRQKDIAAENSGGDPVGSEDQEKSAETMILSQGPGSSATSTLSNTTTQTGGEKMSPPHPFASPDAPYRHISSRRAKQHRPPLPDARTSNRYNNNNTDYVYQVNEVRRASSTREFRNLNRNELLELHDVD